MPEVNRLQPKEFSSDLDEIAREGARRMLAQALEAEVADYERRWRRINGARLIPLVRAGVPFSDGVQPEARSAA